MKIFYLPGLASDYRLFSLLKQQLGGSCLDWIKHQKNESLKAYSKRLAHSLNLVSDSNISLVGFCFGGVIAMEMAQHIKCKSIITINCPGDSGDISDDFRKGVTVGEKIPSALLKSLLAMKGSSFFSNLDSLNSKNTALIGDMISDLNIDFLRWAATASANWEQAFPLDLNCTSLALHGEIDPIIKRPKSMRTELMDGVGHLAPLTHSDELSTRIKQFWKKVPCN